ncbi:MAG: adenylosuccinate lyase [Muribaculaceae bacterium]|nr:adenylosuccinate lyase [Muribaculaceae bacterium]MBQ2491367.1 adenylosuccinate lyase [Muribaculaceae bacterium]MBQ4008065.1 adenylosuccinate lyase [Muribaculaceae bacterium]
MMISPLTAVSPIDGRYHSKTQQLSQYFSEFALIRYRAKVEIEYFIALCNIPLPQLKGIDPACFATLRGIYENFTEADAQRIKDIEAITNHDVKAVEYFLKECFDQLGLQQYKEFIHFGLTSQDINNTATPMSIKDALNDAILPAIGQIIAWLNEHAQLWHDVPMLAKTHGQPASPTRMGKELRVFAYRLEQQLQQLQNVPVSGKFGGATGNFNAHLVTYPDINWIEFANRFLSEQLGIDREQFTTQISNYDNLGAIFDALKRISTILIDLDRDIWLYISMNYFKQKIKAGEVGSSAMPHKVNPIDFENSEGNLGIAIAILEHLAHKLPVSRLQRDLTDSTVLRNVGVPFGHFMIATASTLKGLGKLILNADAIETDLQNTWAVVAEAMQTILRREGYPKPYETLKQLTRTNEKIDAQRIAQFVDSLEVSDQVKAQLKAITPHNYTGY